MPTQISSAFSRILAGIREFTIAQRTLAFIGVAVLVLGGIALTTWLTRPTYAPLFSGLSGEDAAAITEQLTTEGVDYQLTDGGATILVPADSVDSQRLSAAAAGLPAGGTSGYALLDDMGVTTSEFQQNVTYKRAIEGELAKTLESMDGVRSASVQLAIPEESVFVSQQQDPTASVFVQTAPGQSLSANQVQAIVHLTSASVDGMSATNVTVVDQAGNVLSAAGSGAAGGTSQQQSDASSAVRAAVQAQLDAVLGAGNANVVANVQVSAESATQTSQTFEVPEGAPALTEQNTTETYGDGSGSGSGQTATGILGPDNIAVPNTADGQDGANTADQEAANGYISESGSSQNALNSVTEERVIPAGAIDRQTISVALNSDTVTGVTANQVSDLVAAAAGIDPTRGDTVAVEFMSFSTQGAEAAQSALADAAAQEQQQQLTQIITTAIVVLGVLIAAILFFLLVSRLRKRDDSPLDLGSLNAEADIERALGLGAPDAAPQLRPAAFPEALPPTAAMPQATPELAMSGARARADIDALAQSSPERTADLLRGLMDERGRV